MNMRKILVLIFILIGSILCSYESPDSIIIPAEILATTDSITSSWGSCIYDDHPLCATPNPIGAGNTSTWQIAQRKNCEFGGSFVQHLLVLEFNTSSIPDDAVIDQIILGISCDSVFTTLGSPSFSIQGRDMLDNGRPSLGLTNIQLYSDAIGGDDYFSGVSLVAGDREITLNANAENDLDSLLTENWFALSVLNDELLGTYDTVIAWMKNSTSNYYIKVVYSASVTCTVRTSFDGGEVIVDSATYTSPYVDNWVADDPHTLEVDSIQSPESGVRYEFRSWSDGGARHHEVISGDTNQVYEAIFEQFYRVWLNSPYGTTTGDGWHTPGSNVNISVEPETVFNADTTIRHIFQGWVGTGSGSYTGSSNTATITVNEPIIEDAQWDTMYYLTVTYSGVPDSIPYLTGEGWHSPDIWVDIFAQDSIQDAGVWYYFDHWTGGTFEDSVNNDTRVYLDYPITITAYYIPDPELQIFPPESTIVFPGDTIIIPAILDALIDVELDSFQFDLLFDTTELEFDTIEFAIIPWTELQFWQYADTIRVFIDQPGPTGITPPETLFYYRFVVPTDATLDCTPLEMMNFLYDVSIAETRPGTVCVRAETVAVSIGNDFGAGIVWVDGSSYSAPYSTEWIGGSEHTISAESLYHPETGVELRFVDWNDGITDRERNITPISDTTFIAQYDSFFLLDITSDYGTISGEGYYLAHTLATFSVSPETVLETSGTTRHIFDSWDGDYIGTENPAEMWMSSPAVVMAQWNTEHYIAMEYTGCGSAVPTLTGEGWHNEDEWVSISTDSFVADGVDTFFFVQWLGGTIDNRFEHSAQALVLAPDTITALYGDTPFYIKVFPPETSIVEYEPFDIPILFEAPVSITVGEIYLEVQFDYNVLNAIATYIGSVPFDSIDYSILSDRVVVRAFGDCTIHDGDTLFSVRFSPITDTVSWTEISTTNPSSDIFTAEIDTGNIFIKIPLEINIFTSYDSATVYVDSEPILIPVHISAYAWDTVYLNCDSVQYPQDGIQLIFLDWSGTTIREIELIPENDTTLTANFGLKYRVDILSDWGTPAGSGWYSEGTGVGFSVTPDSVHDGESYNLFDNWTGTGSGAYSGTDNPGLCYVYGPITEQANWNSYHYLTLDYSGCGSAVPTLTGEGWYSESTSVPISAQDSILDGSIWYFFAFWVGPVTDRFSPSTNIELDEPYTLIAVYDTITTDFILRLPDTMYSAPGEYLFIPVIFDGSIFADYCYFKFNFDFDMLGLVDVFSMFDSVDIDDYSEDNYVVISGSSASPVALESGDTVFTLICVSRDTVGNSVISIDSLGEDFYGGMGNSAILSIGEMIHISIYTCESCTLSIDDEIYIDSFDTNVSAGTSISIEAPQYQYISENERFVFSGWSDYGERRRTITPTADFSVFANYYKQFYVSIWSELGTIAPDDGMWFDSGDTFSFQVSPAEIISDTVQFQFAGWNGTGYGSYTGANNPASAVALSSIAESAIWDTLYRLDINSTCPSVAIFGEGFYTNNSWVDISANSQGCGQKFSHWSGAVFADSNQTRTQVLIDGWTTVQANYTSNYVSVNSGEIQVPLSRCFPVIYYGSIVAVDTAQLEIEFADTLINFVSIDECAEFSVASDTNRIGNILTVQLEITASSEMDVETGDTLLCVCLDAVDAGITEVETKNLGGDLAGIAGAKTEIITGSQVNVSIVGAENGSIVWDDTTVLSPLDTNAVINSYHTISAAESVIVGGLKLIFAGWSDDSENRNRIVKITADTTFNAIYDSVFFVKVNSTYGTVHGQGWYEQDDSVCVYVEQETLYSGDTRQIFSGWSGTLSYSGNPFVFSVSASETLTANWGIQHYLAIQSDFDNEYGAGWQDDWSLVWIGIAPDTVAIDDYTKAYFTEWTGDIATTDNPVGITMTEPKQIIANWTSKYYIRAYSEYGTVSDTGWYERGDTANIYVTPLTADSTDTMKMVFDAWYGLDSPVYDSSVSFTVTETESLWANWEVEYWLEVDNGGHSSATPSDWHRSGELVWVEVSPDTEYVADGVRWKFIGWVGTGKGSYTGENNPAQVRIGSPITQMAQWEKQFLLNIDYTGVSGVEPEISGDGYHSAHSSVEICAQQIVYDGSVRYHFTHWSGGTFPDSSSYCTTIELDTNLTITANYGALEVSPIDTITGALNETLYVPIMLYSDATEIINTIQFDLHFPDGILQYIRVEESPTGVDWSSLSGSPSGNTVVIFASRTNYFATPPETLLVAVFRVIDSGADIMWCDNFRYSIEGATGSESRVYVGDLIPVRIQTDIAESSYVALDGRVYLSPLDTAFYAGQPHTIGTMSELLTGDGEVLIFSHWSDSGDFHHTISLSEPDTIIAHFSVNYWLEVNSSINETWGTGWYPAGDSAFFGVAPRILQSENARYKFDSWVGYGSGAYSGSDISTYATISEPTEQYAQWNREYNVIVSSPYGEVSGSGWYAHGETAEIQCVPDTIYLNPVSRKVFWQWTGSSTSADNPLNITVNSPININAYWRDQYHLTVSSRFGTPSGEGWYLSGEEATVSITPSIVDSGGVVRYEFAGWTGYMDTSDVEVEFSISSPCTMTALWNRKVSISGYTDWGTIIGTGYYYEGDTAGLLFSPETTQIGGWNYVFAGWLIAGDTIIDNPVEILVEAPITAYALFDTLVQLEVNSTEGTTFGSDFYHLNENILFGLDSTIIDEGTTQRVFSRWEGFGTDAYSGGGNPAQIISISAPVVENAIWKTRYFVEIISDIGSPAGEGWYWENDSAGISIQTIVDTGLIRYHFAGWSGDISTSDNPARFLVSAPMTIQAIWDTTYFVELYSAGISTEPELQGEGYYNSSESCQIYAENIVLDGGIRYHFERWSGLIDTVNNPFSFTVANAGSICAEYGTFEVSPKDTIIGAPSTTIDVPVIIYDNISHHIDTVELDLIYCSSLSYVDVQPSSGISWDNLNGTDMTDRVRISAYRATATTVSPPETLFYVRFDISASPVSGQITCDSLKYDISTAGTVPAVFIPEIGYSITLSTSCGCDIVVDGSTETSPYSTNWNGGEVHQIAAPETTSGIAGERFVFLFWSDGDTNSERTILVQQDTTLEAIYIGQIAIGIFNYGDYGNPSPIVGTYWVDSTETLTAVAGSPDEENYHYCNGFTGFGVFTDGANDSLEIPPIDAGGIIWKWTNMIP
ncbi:hypothetical protein DRQ33_01710, partial [bacterium]